MHHVIILGSRRSGSTAFWRLFRHLPEHIAYDEPFNPLLTKLPRDNRHTTRREFVALYEADPERFRSHFAPVSLSQEMARGMSEEQKAYLGWLLGLGPAVIDVTRCHAKIPELHAVAPDASFVHLYRRPKAFVTSHLLPTNGLGNFRLREWWGSRTFFSRTSGFNKWHMEDLLTGAHSDNARRLLEDEGVRVPERGAPAVLHLMAYWLGCYRLAEEEGRQLYGDRFASVDFEAFCEEPVEAPEPILRALGDGAASLDFSHLRRPRRGFRPRDPRWAELAEEVGFTTDEVVRLTP